MSVVAENPMRLPLKNRPMASAIERLMGLDALADIYDRRPAGCDTREFLNYILNDLDFGISINCDDERWERIPKTGPLLVVANHPLGGLEGIAISKMLMDIRPDVKVLTNELLTRMPEFQSIFIGVNVLSNSASRENVRGLREATRHLCNGGVLLMFPGGKVASLNVRNRRIEDHPWNRLAGKLIQRSGADCLPIHVEGYNSRLFYSLGLIHPRLRTVMLPRELTNKRGANLKLTIGEPITQTEIRFLEDAEAITHYIRLSTEFQGLDKTDQEKPPSLTFEDTESFTGKAAVHLNQLQEYLLIENEPFEVYCIPYEKLGPLMQEIGVAREITFRAAGEGTGNAVDSDRFDPHYEHLFIWDRKKGCIAGGYRIGRPHEIADEHGIDAIYARTLFNFDRAYLDKVGPALEMGRSFVYPDYQRHPKILDLLWRGIGAYVARNPEHHILFGAVSISREYSSFARALIAESMVEAFSADSEWCEDVQPIVPLKVSKKPWSKEMLAAIRNVSALNKLVGRCDPQKTLPVLLRHYLALNGRFVCFSVNKVFNDSLDGLILVDIRKMPRKYLNRYLGKEQAEALIGRWNSQTETEKETP